MKIEDYCQSNKQMGQVCAPEDLQTPRKKCRPPGKRLWVKNAHSKQWKCPLIPGKTVKEDLEKVKMKVSRVTLRWAGLKV